MEHLSWISIPDALGGFGRRGRSLLLGLLLAWGLLVQAAAAAAVPAGTPPLDPNRLKSDLSLARGTVRENAPWPRKMRYGYDRYDHVTDSLRRETRSVVIARKPRRIIPHAVGVAEILWAICPRERLVAFNDITADPDSSFIADSVRRRGPIFRTAQTELVIGYRPDLVFTVFYSGAEFKEKLRQARIPSFDLGHFGSMESVREQILLIGRIIGEEGNARALIRIVDDRMRELRRRIPRRQSPLRILYYDEGGYVPGRTSNFSSICSMIGAVNVGAEQGITSWSRIDYETLLRWNPDVIIVPARGRLKELLMSNRLLSHSRAVRGGSVHTVPDVYLRATSQYMLLSANYLAGVIYRAPR